MYIDPGCCEEQQTDRSRKGQKGDILNYLKQSKHLWIIPAYGIFYMAAFMLMEQSDVKIHIIHSLADDRIPFCPYFIIPYVLWYFFLIGTVIYFAVSCPSKKEYYQYLGTLGVGMTLFLLISYVYPNGQQLRPDLSDAGNGIFISVIRFLYKIDTPTNIFPSMHVFNATASCIALYQNERCRKNKVFTVGQIVLTVSIVLSTMFLKQHSVADVMTALILNILCYQLFYRVIPARQKRLSEVFTRREICTLPNLLSAVRLCLAIAFFGIFERYGVGEYRRVLVLLIIAAALTDILDGRIARSFDSVSRVGRILDPVADKVMQGAMIAYLIPRYPLAKLVLILFVVKECHTAFIAWKVLMETRETVEPQWHGKLNTAVTYAVMLILLAGPRLLYATSNVLIGACAVCMAMSFGMYVSEFRQILERQNGRYRRKMQGGFSR